MVCVFNAYLSLVRNLIEEYRMVLRTFINKIKAADLTTIVVKYGDKIESNGIVHDYISKCIDRSKNIPYYLMLIMKFFLRED